MKILNQSFAGHALTVIMLLASPFVCAQASAAQLAITSVSLPTGVVGMPYTTTLAATGGTAPYTWTVARALPTGLTLAPATGVITGVPTTAGTSNFLIVVTDNVAANAITPFAITIQAAITPLLISTAATLPGGMVGSVYSQALAATGGVAPYVWSLASGTLPPGLNLSSAGVISGTPTTQGTSTFSALVADSLLSTASKAFSLTINPIGPTRAGVLSQLASGGGWKTSIYLVNTSSTSIPVVVKFWSDSGAVLSLPFTMSESGAIQVGTASSATATVAPNDTMLIESDSGASLASTGWVEVISTGHITGYGAFHYTSPSGVGSEGTVALQSEFESSFILPYDGVGHLDSGIALTNLTPGSATQVIATVWGNGGKQIASQAILLPAGGHTAFVLSTLFPGTVGNRGFVEFTAPASSTFTGLGLRVDPVGGITSVPVLQRP